MSIKCKICGNESDLLFKHLVRRKYEAEYFKCKSCGFVFINNPTWLEEAYANPINDSDTGILIRNIVSVDFISLLIFSYFKKRGEFLDYAGGYGIFTRLMRDYGFDFYWYDPYTDNIFVKGFEKNITDNVKFEAITAWEFFEHVEDPVQIFKELLCSTNSIFFSTETISSKYDVNWHYFGYDHGQHISFYERKTFYKIAEMFNLNYYYQNDFHLLTRKKLNGLFIKMIFLISKTGFSKVVKKIMKSKTYSDHEKILKNGSNHENT